MNLMIKSNRLYDTLKYIAQVVLPGVGALYFGLAQVWHLPNAEEVVGTVTVVDSFLGVLLKKSSDNYEKSDLKYDGEIHVDEKTGTAKLSSEDVSAVVDAGKTTATFKVKKAPTKKPAKKAVTKIADEEVS